MKLKAIDHITINMIKVDESFAFYEDVFGLEKGEVIDMGDHVLHYYKLPGAKLELIEYKEKQKVVQLQNTDIGMYRHFAVTTDDLKAVEKACVAAGYGINLVPTYIPQIGKTIMLVKDPNCVEIEVIQE